MFEAKKLAMAKLWDREATQLDSPPWGCPVACKICPTGGLCKRLGKPRGWGQATAGVHRIFNPIARLMPSLGLVGETMGQQSREARRVMLPGLGQARLSTRPLIAQG